MPKLPSRKIAATSFQHDADSLDVVVSDDEGDCALFEKRLNDWVDLRSGECDISSDPHLLICDRCKTMLDDYQAMLEATKLLGVLHDGDEDALSVVGRASLDRLPTDSVGSQFFGWSTLLAVLFVFWGGSAGIPTNVGLIESVSVASLPAAPSEFVSDSNFVKLSRSPADQSNHLMAVGPLEQSTPVSYQTLFEMPNGGLLAAGLPVVDLSLVDMEQLNHIGKYWRHASRLPGIEPWQHSVNFAIGWFNQPAISDVLPECG